MSDPLDRAVDARIDAYRPGTAPPFEAIEARKRGRDRRRLVIGGAVLSVTAIAVAVAVGTGLAAGLDQLDSVAGPAATPTVGIAEEPGPQRPVTPDSAPVGRRGPTVQPAYGGSFAFPARWGTRPGGAPSQLPAPRDGRLSEVTPAFADLRVGVYVSTDDQLCSGTVFEGGGTRSCPGDLVPGWEGIHLESMESPLSVSFGYVPATTVGLYRQTGDAEPQPVVLYRGPEGFDHLNFFIGAGGRDPGPERFLGYGQDGQLTSERAAGNGAYRRPS